MGITIKECGECYEIPVSSEMRSIIYKRWLRIIDSWRET